VRLKRVSTMTWLSGWKKRVKLTADHTVIDSDLTDFPALLYISASSGKNNKDLTFVFDEVGANYKKIAVTTGDGVTQCYVEVEKWDAVNEKAWLWVRCPTLPSTTDTDFYLYYDNSQPDNTTYVGEPGSAPAQNVWDANFKGVWHLDEDPSGTAPQMKDSTSNNNDGTCYGSMTSGDQVAGKINGSLYFDGVDDDVTLSSPITGTVHSCSIWVKFDTDPDFVLVGGSLTHYFLYATSGGLYYNVGGDYVWVDVSWATNTWYHLAVVRNGTSVRFYVNGSQQGTEQTLSANTSNSVNTIGSYSDDDRWATDGIIDEVRISNVARSAAWIKASYHSGNDSLWTWGAQEVSKTLTETLGLSDSVAKRPSVLKTEPLELADVYSRTWTATRSYTEPVAFSDAGALSILREFLDSYSYTPSITRTWTLVRTYFEDAGLMESRVLSLTRELEEELTYLDEVITTFLYTLELLESYSLTPSRISSVDKRLVENIAHLEEISRVWNILRTLEDYIVFSDSGIFGYARTLLETYSHLDRKSLVATRKFLEEYSLLPEKRVETLRTLLESYTLLDTVTRETLRSLLESYSISLKRVLDIVKSPLPESYSIEELIWLGKYLELYGSYALTDALSKDYTKRVLDKYRLTDSYSRLWTLLREYSEVYSIEELRELIRYLLLTEEYSLTPSLARVLERLSKERLAITSRRILKYRPPVIRTNLGGFVFRPAPSSIQVSKAKLTTRAEALGKNYNYSSIIGESVEVITIEGIIVDQREYGLGTLSEKEQIDALQELFELREPITFYDASYGTQVVMFDSFTYNREPGERGYRYKIVLRRVE